MLRVLFCFLAIRQCLAAVTWRTVGCDGWSFQGKSMDQIWDNAVEMTTQAQSQINLIPTKAGIYSSLQKRAGANAEFMFGVNFRKLLGLDTAGQGTLNTAGIMYSDIREGLQGTLQNLDTNSAILFCGGDGLVKEPIPGVGGSTWHARIANDETTEYLTLSYVTAGSPKPCTEVFPNNYQGKTFTTIQIINNVQTEFVGIILCPNQWVAAGLDIFATLDNGYTAAKKGANKYPYIGNYNSMSGTLVHEMTHVVGRVKYNKKWDDDGNYGFRVITQLAKDNQATALITPDAYRIFAEMSMSPATQWGMPNPS